MNAIAKISPAATALVVPVKAQTSEDGLNQAGQRYDRPWGYYETLSLGARFQVKRIVVNPGETLSLQSHYHRAEHWIVVEGTAKVTRDDEVMMLTENESVYIPLGAVHRLENPGKMPMALIEVQTGTPGGRRHRALRRCLWAGGGPSPLTTSVSSLALIPQGLHSLSPRDRAKPGFWPGFVAFGACEIGPFRLG